MCVVVSGILGLPFAQVVAALAAAFWLFAIAALLGEEVRLLLAFVQHSVNAHVLTLCPGEAVL
jgi:hypothetical protein